MQVQIARLKAFFHSMPSMVYTMCSETMDRLG